MQELFAIESQVLLDIHTNGCGPRHALLAIATFLDRQTSVVMSAPPVRGMDVKTRIAGIKGRAGFKEKIYVSLIPVTGASCRLRRHTDLVPGHVRTNAEILPPALRRRGRPKTKG